MPSIRTAAAGVVFLAGSLWAWSGTPGTPAGPLSPTEERATFRLAPGLRIDLVASEPEVVDPVALAFDERGRLFVAEMRGYPNEGVGTGPITSGRIRLLEDRDGDGVYEHATVFADGLRFPTGLMVWRGKLLVANAPDILMLEDRDGDGRADGRTVLYTGFGVANIQQLVNSPQWGLDNWVYFLAAGNGGSITCPGKPSMPAVALNGRGVRFHPDEPGSLEPTSSGGQYGLAPDESQRWFTATNSQHLRHIVLADHYLRRNPALAVPAVTVDIPDHGAACPVFRISPFEAWRVERTRRRKEGADAARFPSTELVPGGFITSACSPLVYAGGLFPEEYRGNTLVCDPANNLVHRDVLVPRGATFTARRAEATREFLASTDTWFRPVHLAHGPDGAVYLLDFYREAIETPLSLPEDIKKSLNLQSRGRGRIWRIAPEGSPPREGAAKRVRLDGVPVEQLVEALASDNLWVRLTAQRLLVERQQRGAAAGLRELAKSGKTGPARAHALWALDGLGALGEELIVAGLGDREAGVREQALRLAEGRMKTSAAVRRAAAARAADPDGRVRFQAALSLGAAESPEAAAALARIARQDAGDPWTVAAVLSSAGRSAGALLEALAPAGDAPVSPEAAAFLGRLAQVVGARGDEEETARVLRLLGEHGGSGGSRWPEAVLRGLGQGAQGAGKSVGRLWDRPPASLKEAAARARALFEGAAATARDEKGPAEARVAAVRLLAVGPPALAAAVLGELLSPRQPVEVQVAAARGLGALEGAAVAGPLLEGWTGYSPAVRREVLEALLSRPERAGALLDAVEKKQVAAGQIEPARTDQLRRHPDAKVRARAAQLLAGAGSEDRRKVIEKYRQALERAGDAGRGKVVFGKVCAACHRLDGVGQQVGADLLAALRTKTPEQLLTDILDPSREVDPRYINYLVTTKNGRTFSGLIAAETAASVTLVRAEKEQDTVLRSQIEEIVATPKSLMPEGLEEQLSAADVADVIAYLLRAGGGK